jgi:hypothetical protein
MKSNLGLFVALIIGAIIALATVGASSASPRGVEFKIIVEETGPASTAEPLALSQLGKQGWSLVAVAQGQNFTRFFLQRPIQP